MQIQTRRFGNLYLPDDRVITMKKPIIGFERINHYCIVENEEFRPFLWLQAVEDPAVSFIVVNPVVFFSDYRIEVHSNEIAELEVRRVEAVETYVIVTVPDRVEDMSVNLQGPILINTETNFAKQLVLVNSDYKVCHRILDDTVVAEEPAPVSQEVLVGV